MTQPLPPQPTDKRRVKVYELRNNEWYDRGTGFCTAAYIPISDSPDEDTPREPRVIVESEDHPDRVLLDVRICKEDGFQQQQDTLLVWTEPTNGVDMALSFQEAEGCRLIWKFVSGVQSSFRGQMAHDDSLSDDLALDAGPSLPPPELASLPELEHSMRMMASSNTGREALTKCIMSEDYIGRLIPLVEMAEDLESLDDLHRLCNIMKTILLLNDSGIIEHAVSDECIEGVVGALEYDPDFPSHKANHRQWLKHRSRYIEVVKLQDPAISRKVHQTHRLQYLKDVVLARILDDPTFSVLNSLIFFNQVDIVNHLGQDPELLMELFGKFTDPSVEPIRQKEALQYIQQCCAIAKNLQPPIRQVLYNSFLTHGLLHVINFGLRQPDVTARVGATDILVSMIDHDPQMVRQTIYRQIRENQPPLTDALIDLLLAEVDLGIKSQISDALKVLLDPNPPPMPPDASKPNGEPLPRRPQGPDPEQDGFLQHFYDHSAARLFRPLLELEGKTVLKFSVADDGVFNYLNDILCFYIRQHMHRCKLFILQNNISQRFLQLLACDQKHVQLVAIRFFRQLIALKDEFWIRQIAEKQVLGPILDVLIGVLPRDNLLGSACLDVFAFIHQESIKDLARHLVETHREKVQFLTSLSLFRDILDMYDKPQGNYSATIDGYFYDSEESVLVPRPNPANTRGMMEHLAVDPDEEAFWNGSDEEEELQTRVGPPLQASGNGAVGPKPLVDYASDDDVDENGDTEVKPTPSVEVDEAKAVVSEDDSEGAVWTPTSSVGPPPERLSEKRRREEDEEDEIDKLMQTNKRRNSGSATMKPATGLAAGPIRRSRSLTGRDSPSNGNKKIAISISPALKLATTGQSGSEDGSE
ncbi:hypothetical protein MCOR25_000974 [Pyricularia grisea]|nr:hypothetical protein MCOR25_000974 [Pyricularia grisea]